MPYLKKLGVFISSTFKDLEAVRHDVILAIIDAGHIPMGMEFFRPGGAKLTAMEDGIKQADVYLLILGGTYGSLKDEGDISYIEHEYEYAHSLGKKIFIIELGEQYLLSLASNIHGENVHRRVFEDNAKKRELYEEFREKLQKYAILGRADDKAALLTAITNTLNALMTTSEIGGWTHTSTGTMTWDHYIDLIQKLANMLHGPESDGGYHYNTLVGVNSGGLLTCDLLSKKINQNFPILGLYSSLETDVSDFTSLDKPFNNEHVLNALENKSASRILIVDSILRPISSIEYAYKFIHERYPGKIIKTAVLIADSSRRNDVDYYVEERDTNGVRFPYHSMNYTFV